MPSALRPKDVTETHLFHATRWSLHAWNDVILWRSDVASLKSCITRSDELLRSITTCELFGGGTRLPKMPSHVQTAVQLSRASTSHGRGRSLFRWGGQWRLLSAQARKSLSYRLVALPPRPMVKLSPDFITPTLRQLKSATQITSPTFVICFRDKSATLSRTCPGLCHGLCRKHLNMSRWFVSATFVICVHDFPRGEVSVKVGVMEFGL